MDIRHWLSLVLLTIISLVLKNYAFGLRNSDVTANRRNTTPPTIVTAKLIFDLVNVETLISEHTFVINGALLTGSHGDLLGNHSPTNDGKSRTKRVTKNPTNTNPGDILSQNGKHEHYR